ncbi:hypothetical protein HYS82_00760 [Candidatus Amesbacteria bacterium]|nr:hypothetical protein [Candidatus Amesbacteria bacterium]
MKKDLLVLILLCLPAFALLFQPGYFSMHDDLQATRQLELNKCFEDGQIPCRWVPDMGYGFGYPLFNYYPPLPYLIGQPFHWLGFQFIDIVKIVGILGFMVTAANMYLLGREFWGRLGGYISAAFYTYAPYHSVDFWVRGAVNEFWAMALYPLIFYSTYKLIQTHSKKYIPLVSLSVAALMLSHNPMLMIFAPVLLVWCLFWIVKLKALEALKALIISALWSLGLAAFFTLPVLFETKFVSVWTLTSGYFNYLAHFLDLKQIFLNINWGYGSSQLGPSDTMSFALGYLHWIVPVVIAASTLFIKKLRSHKYLILLLLLFTVTSLFMSHSKSTPIWLALKPLEFLQFPWRFLTLAVFGLSFLSGAIARILPRYSVPLLLLLLLLQNANYFRPREWYPDMTDAKKFSGKSWQLQITSGIFDYLPKWAPLPPPDPKGNEIDFVDGFATFKILTKKSNLQKYEVNVLSPNAIAEIQTYYFPGWKTYVDNREVSIDYSSDKLLGRMQVTIPSGTHQLLVRLTNTPIRTIGNTFSILSLGLLGLWTIKTKGHAIHIAIAGLLLAEAVHTDSS